MGDFCQSNVVDDDLNMQPDQNKSDVMGGGTSGVENVGDFGHSNVLDESNIDIETECVKKNEERSVSRVSNESFGSVTLPDYLNIEKSQDSISNEPESDLDISFNSESGSEWLPSVQEIREREREMSDNEKISIKKKNKA